MRTPLVGVELLDRIGGLVEEGLARAVDRHIDDARPCGSRAGCPSSPRRSRASRWRRRRRARRRESRPCVQRVLEMRRRGRNVLAGVCGGLVVEQAARSQPAIARPPRASPSGLRAPLRSSPGSPGWAAPCGRRQTGSSRPISAIAAFTGIGIRFDEIDFHQRQVLALQSARARRNRRAGRLARAASSRREFRSRPPRSRRGRRARISGMVMASSPREHGEIAADFVEHRRHLADVARGFLHADDVVDFGEALQRGRLDVDAGAALHAVDDDGQADGGGDGFVVLIQAFLRGLVVVRRDGENAVGAQVLAVRARVRSLRRCCSRPRRPAREPCPWLLRP